MIASPEVLGSPTARALRSKVQPPRIRPATLVLRAFARARHGLSLKDGEILKSATRARVTQRLAPLALLWKLWRSVDR